MTRTQAAVSCGILILSCAVLSCSYDTLTFFFDGVPEPGSETADQTPAPDASARGEEAEPGAPTAPKGSSHEPMNRQNCKACHLPGSLQTLQTAEQGLCATCHAELVADLRFVHGPVAVQACLLCHLPHGSEHPHLLREPPTLLCLSCHEQGHLEHHAPETEAEAQVACIECHSGHGGDNPFFLR